LRKLPLPANFTILPFRSLLGKEIRPPLPCNRNYGIFSWGIVNIDSAPKRESYRGHFKVGCDVGWGAPASKAGPDPAIIRFLGMLQKMGAKPNRTIPYERYHRHFWFDISTPSKIAFYDLCTMFGGKITATVYAKGSLLNERTRFLDDELLRKIEIMDSFIYAVLSSCNVPREM